MRVTQGWSGEIEHNHRWAKISVTLDEDDLTRMLLNHDRWSNLPQQEFALFRTEIPTGVAYGLLSTEAERLILVKLIASYDYPRDQAVTRINELLRQQRDFIEQLRGMSVVAA